MKRWLLPGLLALPLLGSVAPRASAQPPLPYPPVPEPREEVIPPPPGDRYVWEPGHWHWNGAQYAWAPGHYVIRGPGYGRYVPGHWGWSAPQGRWVWHPAHWVP